MARKTFDLRGSINDARDRAVRSVYPRKIGGIFQGLPEREPRICKFRDRVADMVRDTEHSADITHGGSRLERVESDYLRDILTAVALYDIILDLLSSLDTEINIEIGHTHSFGIEKSFKKQIVSERVYAGYPYTVRAKASGSRTSSGTYGDILLFRKIHKIPYDQEVIGIPHLRYDFKFIFHPLRDRAGAVFPVSLIHSVICEVTQKSTVVIHSGSNESRQSYPAELKLNAAPSRDKRRIFYGVLVAGKKSKHLIGGFHIIFIGLKTSASFFALGLVHSDTVQDILQRGVLFFDIMTVIRRDERYPRFLRQSVYRREYGKFLFHAMVLYLKEKIIASEYSAVFFCGAFGFLILPAGEQKKHPARHTDKKADKPLVVFFDKFRVGGRNSGNISGGCR